MFKFLAFALLTLILIAGCANTKIPISSIQQFGDLHENGESHHFCTAWATKLGGMTKWVTAAHCVTRTLETIEDEHIDFVVGNKKLIFERLDTDADIALFSGPSADGLSVSFMDVEVGTPVKAFLFFFVPDGLFVQGWVSGSKESKRLYQFATGPGASGGPVLNESNVVVGMSQFAACPGVCPIAGGSSVKEIRKFLYGE